MGGAAARRPDALHRFFTSKWRMNGGSGVSGCSHRPASRGRDCGSLSRFLSRQRARPFPAPGRALFFGPRSCRTAVIRAVAHDHSQAYAEADSRRLAGAFLLIVAFMVAEVVAGILASSLALISDAGHMLTDAVALGLALAALRLAQRPPSGSFTYGLRRAEILSAQINGITLLLLGVLIVYEGIRRLIEPPEVDGALVLIVALVGSGVHR